MPGTEISRWQAFDAGKHLTEVGEVLDVARGEHEDAEHAGQQLVQAHPRLEGLLCPHAARPPATGAFGLWCLSQS